MELLKDNPEWGTADRRYDMNHFMARLIFCFFAEDTDIFNGKTLFTSTIEQMSAKDSSNTHTVISEIFRAMNTPTTHNGVPDNRYRKAANTRSWADQFPYVNGDLFSGSTDAPRFSKIARSYLLHVGGLDWTQINPDIFGSMIQAVAEDEERGALGMHYTSVPNILKVLNPLFLDDLRARLEEAGDNPRMLLNLRKRMAKIRVFDPACGSGNFLVIAYKQMREIEAAINCRRGEAHLGSEIPLTNFRGIELRDFPAEIARLALVIAEYQCDVIYRGQKVALAEFLPLDAQNWITCGNALRVDWLSICPPTGTGVNFQADDLFSTPLDQAQIDFENEGGETYVCGNPQFKGARKQTKAQKEDMSLIFQGHNDFKDCDYVTAWYLKAAEFIVRNNCSFAFVSTSSISEGEQVSYLWSRLYALGCHIVFAHQGFKWQNNAAHNAVVQCVIIGIGYNKSKTCHLYDGDTKREVPAISPYLIAGPELFVQPRNQALNPGQGSMVMGSMARDDGNLLLTNEEASELVSKYPTAKSLLRELLGSQELIHYRTRKCIWIEDDDVDLADSIPEIKQRIENIKFFRLSSSAQTTKGYAAIPHKFAQRAHKNTLSMIVAATSSEERPYLPADILRPQSIITNAAYAVYNPQLWEFSVIVSKLHYVWVKSICGKLETRIRYSSTLGWNTFPFPPLTEKSKADLTRCAEDILVAREAHFPATIADLYDAETMPENLRHAHERNDEVLERIYDDGQANCAG